MRTSHWASRIRRPGRSSASLDERGVTLLELVVAITLLGIIMAGAGASVGSGLNLSRNNRHRSVAANLASEEMDVVRSSDFMTLAPRTITQTVDGVDYLVRRDLTWVAKSASNGPCDGSGGNPQVLRVRVQVTWSKMSGIPAVRSDTLLTPPVGAFDPLTGHVAVKVFDRDAQPQESAIVSITGPQNKTLPTNTDGCAFFAFLPAGTYTVRLNTVGYVDKQSNPQPTQTRGVTIGVVSSVQFDYDRAATINATLVPTDGGTVPNDLALMLANSQYLPNGVRAFTGTGPTRIIGNLFPALEGYEVWAGECADADPEGLKIVGAVNFGPYWPGAVRAAGIAPAGGDSVAADVALPTVAVHVADTLAAPVAGVSVSAVHAADNVCGAGATHVLGTTDANGDLSVALPYGHWQLTVAGRTPQGGTWPELVVDPTATTPVSAPVGVN